MCTSCANTGKNFDGYCIDCSKKYKKFKNVCPNIHDWISCENHNDECPECNTNYSYDQRYSM